MLLHYSYFIILILCQTQSCMYNRYNVIDFILLVTRCTHRNWPHSSSSWPHKVSCQSFSHSGWFVHVAFPLLLMWSQPIAVQTANVPVRAGVMWYRGYMLAPGYMRDFFLTTHVYLLTCKDRKRDGTFEICLRDALPPRCTKNPVLRPFLVVTMELAFAPWL